MESEVTLQELADLLNSGKITTDQYVKILSDNVGLETVMKAFNEIFHELYGDLNFSNPLPDSLNMMFRNEERKPNETEAIHNKL